MNLKGLPPEILVEMTFTVKLNSARRNMLLYRIFGIGECIFGLVIILIIILAIIIESASINWSSLIKFLGGGFFVTICVPILKKSNDCRETMDFCNRVKSIVERGTKLSYAQIQGIIILNKMIDKGETITDNFMNILRGGGE